MAEININNLSPLTGNMVASDGNVYNIVDILLEGGGGSAVIEELNVTPTTSAQIITAPSGTDGYNPVNISAVTSSIDNNITANNIKDGVEILGVTGNLKTEKFGATIDMFIGNVNTQGTLISKYYPQALNFVFTGVKRINMNALILTRFPHSFNLSFPDLEELGQEALFAKVSYSDVKNVIFDKITTINTNFCLYEAFAESYIESISFPELTTMGYPYGSTCEGMCRSDTDGITAKLISAYFPKLTTIDGPRTCARIFQSQKNLTSFPFNKVQTISGREAMAYAMQYCSNTEINFEELTTINGNTVFAAFNYGNTALTKVYFPKLNSIIGTDVFGSTYNGMLYNCTNCTEIHFKSDMQPTISALTGYSNKWGATNATIYFDL